MFIPSHTPSRSFSLSHWDCRQAACLKELAVAQGFEENWGFLRARPEECKPRAFETRLVKYFSNGQPFPVPVRCRSVRAPRMCNATGLSRRQQKRPLILVCSLLLRTRRGECARKEARSRGRGTRRHSSDAPGRQGGERPRTAEKRGCKGHVCDYNSGVRLPRLT